MTDAQSALAQVREALAAGPTHGPWSLKTVPTSDGSCHKIGPFPSASRVHSETHACVYASGIRLGIDDSTPVARELLANARLIAACSPANVATILAHVDAQAAALVAAEAALADIGDADREPGDDIKWAERRAMQALPIVRNALARTRAEGATGMTDREMLELAAKQASDLAARLDGSEYPLRLSKEMLAEAKAAGLVIVYGASDDLMEFDGAIYDELGCYDGGTAFVDAQGLLDRSQIDDDDEAIADFVVRKRKARTIEAKWCCDGFSWSYQTDIPHATFIVMEDGEPYCRGIVFAIESLTQEQPK